MVVFSSVIAFACGMFGCFLIVGCVCIIFLKRKGSLPPIFKPRRNKKKAKKPQNKPVPKERDNGFEKSLV